MATTILTTAAAEQLGIEESQLRELLKPLYGNASTVKRISMKTFKSLAEGLQEAALQQEENQDIDVEAIEKEALLVAAQTPAFFAGDEIVKEEGETSYDDHHADDNGRNTSVFSPDTRDEIVKGTAFGEERTQTVNIADATSFFERQQEQEEQEETALTNIPTTTGELETKIKQALDATINLDTQTLDLLKITQTLAVLSADESVELFRNIYTARLNQGIESFLSEFSLSAIQAVKRVQGETAEDFFNQLQTHYPESTLKDNMKTLASFTA